MKSSNKLVKYVIKSGGLVCDVVYFNPLPNFKQWYTTCENENQGITLFRFNTVILPRFKLNSINDVFIPDIASNNL